MLHYLTEPMLMQLVWNAANIASGIILANAILSLWRKLVK